MEQVETEAMNKWVRLIALVFCIVSIILLMRYTGVTQEINIDTLRTFMRQQGWLGFAIFTLAFCIGLIVHVPGIVFLAAAVAAYGPLEGISAAIVAGSVAISVVFFFVRKVGGQPLTGLKSPFVQRWLARLDKRPISSTIVLRIVLWVVPPLNYALAMSSMKFRDYFIGSVIGLSIPFIIFGYLIGHAIIMLH